MKRSLALAVAMVLILAACAGDSTSGAAQGDTEATIATEAETTTTVTETTAAAETTATTEHMDDEASHDEGDGESTDDHAVAGGLEIVADAAADQVVDVVLTEFAFDPDSFSIKKGETVTFNVRNEGSIPHEFRISNRQAVEAHVAEGHGDHSDEMTPGEPMMMEGDVVLLLDAGQEATLTVRSGDNANYDLVACLLPGHFEAGMEAPLKLE